MSGKIKRMIDEILAERSKGNEMVEKIIRTKLILKGIDPAKYTESSDDDPKIIDKLEKMMHISPL
ncbi:MAG: hypothetical protein VB050_17360 [Geobacteraceae bacterium]|nr:hypothetical protein [Geobacteraceae bacterium]